MRKRAQIGCGTRESHARAVGTRVKGDTMARPADYEDYQGGHGSLPANIQPLSWEIFATNPNSNVWINEQ